MTPMTGAIWTLRKGVAEPPKREVIFGQEVQAMVKTPARVLIQELGIERARELLATTGLSMSEVSERSGFGDVKRFGLFFRECLGVSPSEFRKRVVG